MQRKRLPAYLSVFLTVTLVIALVLVACSQPAPSPKPTAIPTPTATPTPAPTTHPQVSLNIFSGPFGSSSYTAGFALADLISKKSAWLRATAVETSSGPDNIKRVGADKKLGVSCMAALNLFQVNQSDAALVAQVPNMRAIAAYNAWAAGYVVWDPNIKSPADFLGKKIGLDSAQSTLRVVSEALFSKGYEIPYDKFNIQYMGWDGMTDAFLDGTVDIAYVGNTRTGGGKLVPVDTFNKLLSMVKFKIYMVGVPPDISAKVRQATGMPLFTVPIPAKYPGDWQADPWNAFSSTAGYFVDKDMDPDVAYEMTRVIYDNYKDMWPVHVLLTFVSPETMGTLVATEQNFHPGAAKLYKEKNTPIGTSK